MAQRTKEVQNRILADRLECNDERRVAGRRLGSFFQDGLAAPNWVRIVKFNADLKTW
jgi:hypothetical protein